MKTKNPLFGVLQQFADAPSLLKRFLINVVAYGAAIEGIMTVLLNLYLLRLGYGTEFIGTLNSVGLLIFALVSLPIGAVQRFSSRQMMLIGQVLSIVSLIGLPLSLYVDNGQAAFLIFWRIVAMIGLSTYFVHQLPFAMTITRPEWHNRALSLAMAAFSMAAFLGSWLGGLLPGWFAAYLDVPLSSPIPYQLPMFVAALVVFPATFVLRSIPEDEKPGFVEEVEVVPRRSRSDWRAVAGLVGIILVVRAFQTGGVGVLMTFGNVYLDDALLVPTSRIGLISGFGRLIGVPMSLIIPLLIARYGNFKLVHVSLAIICMLIIPMALIPDWGVAAVAIIAINSMGSLRYLSFIGFTMALVSERQRSLMSGAGEMAIGIGFAISSFVGGYLIAWFGYRELFLFGTAMTVIGAIAFWLIFRNRAEAKHPVPAAATH